MLHFNQLTQKQQNVLTNDIHEYFNFDDLKTDVLACWSKRDSSLEYCSREFVKGGNFLIYREEVENLFNDLGIECSENTDIWDQYVELMSEAVINILS